MKKIIAVGNAGGNIADSIRKQGIGVRDAEFVYYDTDTESLYKHGKKGRYTYLTTQRSKCRRAF